MRRLLLLAALLFALPALAAVLLASCGTTYWNHPTKTPQEYYADDLYCDAFAKMMTEPDEGLLLIPALINSSLRTSYHDDCMRAFGWYESE